MPQRDRDTDLLHADLLAESPVADDPPRPSAGLRERLLRSIDTRARFDGFADRLATFLDLAPGRARELLGCVERVRESIWMDDRVAGVRLLHFPGGPRHADADCGLVHIEPGVRYPRHRHPGGEWTFVLAGRAVEEETGRVWLPGDLVHGAAGTAHAYRVEGDAPFVFAIVLRNGLELLEA
jgi:putative transcriptional regulator